jgi:hypothetical protein
MEAAKGNYGQSLELLIWPIYEQARKRDKKTTEQDPEVCHVQIVLLGGL